MNAVMDLARDEAGDDTDLGTAETDVAAGALYESRGFSNREGKPDGLINYYYEPSRNRASEPRIIGLSYRL